MSEKDIERKSFDIRLASTSNGVREKYLELLLEKQLSGAKSNKGKPITVTTEDREAILKRAEQSVFYGNVDSVQMERDWEKATSSEGRPPIGGAQDD